MALPSSLSDLEVRVEFLLENPPCKEGPPPDILLKSALRAEKRPKIRVFSPPSGVPAACLKARVHFFDDFSCFKLRLHSKSDRLLAECFSRPPPIRRVSLWMNPRRNSAPACGSRPGWNQRVRTSRSSCRRSRSRSKLPQERASNVRFYPENRSRPCGRVRSSAGPIGTIRVGLISSCVM